MSNLTSNSANLKELKEQYIELIQKGYAESVALKEINFPVGTYIRLLTTDEDFNSQVTEARKLRAEFWVSKVIADVDDVPEAKDVPGERLRFDKIQFLAKADNPDRYGNNSKKLDISIDLSKFRLLPPEEALKALSADPFADPIEADFTPIEEDLL